MLLDSNLPAGSSIFSFNKTDSISETVKSLADKADGFIHTLNDISFSPDKMI